MCVIEGSGESAKREAALQTQLARAEEDFKIARLGWCSARTSLLGSVSALSALSARPEVAGTPRGGLALASVRAACVCLRVGCCLIQSETESEALAACR